MIEGVEEGRRLAGTSIRCFERGSRSMRQETLDDYPLTFQQEWLSQEVRNGNTLDFLQRSYAWNLTGSLRIASLRRAIDTVADVHDVLKVTVVGRNDTLKMRMHESNQCVLRLHDCRRFDQSTVHGEIREMLRIARCRSRERLEGPPVEISIFVIAQSKYVFSIGLHQLFNDLTSMRLLFTDIWQRYHSIENGLPANTAVNRHSYVEYALWQRGAHERWIEIHSEYWAKKLAGINCVRLITGDPAEGLRASLRREVASLGQALTTKLRDFSREQRMMPAMVILASYALLLRQLAGQGDFVVPFNVSGRHQSNHDRMVGQFGQVLFLRIRAAADESIMDLLKTVSSEFYECSEHLDFGRIAMQRPDFMKCGFMQWLSWDPENLGSEETLSRPVVSGSDMSIEPFVMNDTCQSDTMHYDMVLRCISEEDDIRFILNYRDGLLLSPGAKEFLASLRSVVRSCAWV